MHKCCTKLGKTFPTCFEHSFEKKTFLTISLKNEAGIWIWCWLMYPSPQTCYCPTFWQSTSWSEKQKVGGNSSVLLLRRKWTVTDFPFITDIDLTVTLMLKNKGKVELK